MTRLLAEMRDHYGRILERAEEQLSALETGDEGRLEEILDQKARGIADVREVETRLQQAVAGCSEADLERAASHTEPLRKEVEALLEKIIDRENRSEQRLRETQAEIGEKVQELRQGKKLLKGYETTRRIKPRISRNI